LSAPSEFIEKTMPSKDYQRFSDSCFGNSFGFLHGGIDEKAILNLQGEERREAERELLTSLGTEKDTHSRPVIALGLLRSRAAIKPLKQRLAHAVGVDRIQTALALYRIDKYPESEEIIIKIFQGLDFKKPDERTRQLAVSILPGLGKTDRIVKTLVEAMKEDGMIGYSATASLRTIFIEADDIRDILGKILLVRHDVHKPNFVPRANLVQQASELIFTRMAEE
jgi:hypothetical protein